MTYVIEKGIEIPKRRKHMRGVKYPFDQMEVGDSFEVERDLVVTARAAAHYFGKDHKQVFRSCTTPIGARIWRVA